MQTSLNLGFTLDFLSELRRNNNKTWFDAHRPDYEKARGEFFRLIDEIIDEFRVSDNLQALTARECAARIFRDIRFSKDKSPYKTNLAALVAPGGWKGGPYGYFISSEPNGQSMAAGGLHEPTPEQLNQFRQAVVSDASEVRKIIQARDFTEFFGDLEGERLKTAPKGYPKDHPDMDLLQLKQITVIHRFSDGEVLAPGFPESLIAACRAMKPFFEYLRRIIE